MKLSEVELLRRREKLSSFYGEIKKIVVSVSTPKEDVEDLVQEIFIEAYNHIADVKDMDKLRPWIYKIAYRKLIRVSEKRRKRYNCEQAFAPEDWEFIGFLDEEKDKVFFVEHRRITDEDLFEMVQVLKAPAPEILTLRFAKGYTLKEISEMMGINYNTMKTIERRALQKLKKMIMERSDSDDESEKALY